MKSYDILTLSQYSVSPVSGFITCNISGLNPPGHAYIILGGLYVIEPSFSNIYLPSEDCIREVAVVPSRFFTCSGSVTPTSPTTAFTNEYSVPTLSVSVLTSAYNTFSDPYVPNLNLKSLIVSLQFVT